MKIEIKDKATNNTVLEYESDIIPLVGDWYAGANFEDTHQRTIINRLLLPTVPHWIIVYTTYSFPDFVKNDQELKQMEADLLTQQQLS